MAVELPQGLWERALAETRLAVAEPPAHREAQEDPSPLPRRRARALLASCLTTDRCALAPVRRGVRCYPLPEPLRELSRHREMRRSSRQLKLERLMRRKLMETGKQR